jgi:hypothetical protein
LTAFPQPDRLAAVLRGLDVLAVVDVAENALTEMATHVLPATGQLERADITLAEPTALRSGIQATRAVVPPGGERRPVWWMFAALSRAMGRAAPDPDALDDETYLRGVLARSRPGADDVFAAGPRGIDTPTDYGWVHDELLADGRWSIAPAALLERLVEYVDPESAPFLLAPRREMAWSNSVAYGKVAPGPVVRVNLGAEQTDTGLVTLASDHGELTATYVADQNVREGVVSVTHGHRDANPGALTSGDVGVDALTAMPRVAGLEITVTRRDGNER